MKMIPGGSTCSAHISNDLAAANPEKVKQMAARHDAWLKELGGGQKEPKEAPSKPKEKMARGNRKKK